jgi:hypothetical protein
VKLRIFAILGILIAGTLVPPTIPAARAAAQAQPEISAEASAALQRMGNTLRAGQLSFQAQTIRDYAGASGQPLHIFHTLDVTMHRPNRLLINRTGDDGASKIIYDGKTLVVFLPEQNKYVKIPAPDTIEAMMKEAMGRLHVDFPLADLLSDAPDKAFLSGVKSGEVVNTVTIDGVPCLHMLFAQPPGIELELWLEKTEQSLPRRLIVTYRNLPGQPSFIASFAKWDFSIHPTDADFVFQPPTGATQIALKPAAAARAKAKGQKP